jgi:hypothetical protein
MAQLQDLNIDIICANSAPAKERVERAARAEADSDLPLDGGR